MSTSVATRRVVNYPESDGKPMAETDVHIEAMIDAIEAAKERFKDDPDVYIAGNLLLYYVLGDPKKCLAPDFLYARVPKRQRKVFLLWEEPEGPGAVLEITSKKTKREDLTTKFKLYRDVLKVPEYFLFDPLEEHLRPSLQGHRLRGREYLPIPQIEGRVPSMEMGLHLFRQGPSIRFYCPKSKQVVLTPREMAREAAALAASRGELLRAKDDALRAKDDALRANEALFRAKDDLIRAREDQVQQLLRDLEEARRGQGGPS